MSVKVIDYNLSFSISARQRDPRASALMARPRLYVTNRLAFSQFGPLTYLLSVSYLQALKTPRKVKTLAQSVGGGARGYRLYTDYFPTIADKIKKFFSFLSHPHLLALAVNKSRLEVLYTLARSRVSKEKN